MPVADSAWLDHQPTISQALSDSTVILSVSQFTLLLPGQKVLDCKMEATAENLSMLSTLLTQSLSPQPEIRHPAEKNLNSTELQPGFLLLVLTLVKDDRAALDVRQAAGVYFKNVVRKRWGEVS